MKLMKLVGMLVFGTLSAPAVQISEAVFTETSVSFLLSSFGDGNTPFLRKDPLQVWVFFENSEKQILFNVQYPPFDIGETVVYQPQTLTEELYLGGFSGVFEPVGTDGNARFTYYAPNYVVSDSGWSLGLLGFAVLALRRFTSKC